MLLVPEARHVGILEQVGAVAMIAAVRDIEPDLVQARRPLQRQLRLGVGKTPVAGNLREEPQRARLDPRRLRGIDVIAAHHRPDGALARVLISESTHHVVQQPIAQRAFGHAHLLDAERIEDLGEYHHAARKHRPPLVGERLELQVAAVAGCDHVGQQFLHAARADVLRSGVALAQALADGAHRARAADDMFPAALHEGRLHRLDLEARGESRVRDALGGDALVAEKARAQGYAAELEALEQLRLVALADRELGAAAADVDHQPPPGFGRQRVRHA